MKTIFGIKGFAISEYAIAANAILGIRDSGKTYTATEASEELFEAGIPFVWLDPIGVAKNLRIPGKGRGYPVVVAGGEDGDLPLTVKTVGTIVRAAMAGNISLVLDLFSRDLSKSDWRKIVKETCEILLHENGAHGLRHIFIEEAAEFVPQRVFDAQTFSAVEKVVRMGGNSKLGITLINQRSADLNKSVLELCASVFCHRQRGKNTLLDLKKWLELTDDEHRKKIMATLPDLQSGQCWVLSNELKAPVLVKVPEKNSLHPDRRAAPTADLKKHQPVPADAFVAQMRAALDEKDKPKKDNLSAKQPILAAPAAVLRKDEAAALRDREAAFAAGKAEGWALGWPAGWLEGHKTGWREGIADAVNAVKEAAAYCEQDTTPKPPKMPISIQAAVAIDPDKPKAELAKTVFASIAVTPGSPGDRVMASMAYWRDRGIDEPSREQVGAVAGYRADTGNFRGIMGGLADVIYAPRPGFVALKPGANAPAMSAEDAKSRVIGLIKGRSLTLLDAALKKGNVDISREDLAETTGYKADTGNFRGLAGQLSSVGILTPVRPGWLAFSGWAATVFFR